MKQGSVVKSIAGHDKNRFYCVVKVQSAERVVIANGRRRKLESPKSKNVKHLQSTNTILNLEEVTTNKKLIAALRPFGQDDDGESQL